MKAHDIMVSPVITAGLDSTVSDVAKLLLKNRISAVPVVDDQGKVVGIVSEGDLLHRVEARSERQRSWWLRLLVPEETLAAEYVKARAQKVADVMTRHAITAEPETSVHEIAALLERNSIKRVPITKNGILVGIVSRANLIQAVAGDRKPSEIAVSDVKIREQLLHHLQNQPWAHSVMLNVTVRDGTVDLWGAVFSDAEKAAVQVAAERMPGVRKVIDNLVVHPAD